MSFMDEEILRLRNMNRKIGNLEDGVYIKGELVEFEPCKLFNEKMQILLPKTFVDMPDKIARVKYISQDRPQIIKTDLLGSTNFAFNLFNQKVKKDELSKVADTFQAIIKKINPANVYYEKNTEDVGNLKLSWFDFKGYAIDSQIYYIYYVTSIGGNLLHGIFNCLIDDIQAYKEVAFLVIKSIRDLSEEI